MNAQMAHGLLPACVCVSKSSNIAEKNSQVRFTLKPHGISLLRLLHLHRISKLVISKALHISLLQFTIQPDQLNYGIYEKANPPIRNLPFL